MEGGEKRERERKHTLIYSPTYPLTHSNTHKGERERGGLSQTHTHTLPVDFS